MCQCRSAGHGVRVKAVKYLFFSRADSTTAPRLPLLQSASRKQRAPYGRSHTLQRNGLRAARSRSGYRARQRVRSCGIYSCVPVCATAVVFVALDEQQLAEFREKLKFSEFIFVVEPYISFHEGDSG